MIQAGLISNAHNDLVTDACYDFYGLRLATCSLDQKCASSLLPANQQTDVIIMPSGSKYGSWMRRMGHGH